MPPPQRVHSPEHPVWNLIIRSVFGLRRSISSGWLFSRSEYFGRWGGGVCCRGVNSGSHRQSDWEYIEQINIPVFKKREGSVVRDVKRRRRVVFERSSASKPTTTFTTTSRCCPNTFVAFVLLVFLSCVVPLSTPSSPLTTPTTPTTSSSYSSFSPVYSPPTQPFITPVCPTAQQWISTRGSFCFTLRQTPFLKNLTELRAREHRAITMFCEMDYILEKIDCAQPYSVNRKQCSMCREAYRDWACAMSTDTLETGGMDCGRRVMPCPSCASICHQVMRLCPYLTPDRVQYDLQGDAVAHVSQYGGHPAFYCPLENWHASDPAYGDSCEKGSVVDELVDPDYLHNLCVDPSFAYSKRSVSYVREYKTCCWTYTYSLLSYNQAFEEDATNRVVLNCCDVSGNCDKSDPGNSSRASASSSPGALLYGNRRTANNQVRTQDGRFRELNSYQADDGEDSYEEYSSGREFLEYDADNKRVVREAHEFWIETRVAASGSSSRAPATLLLCFVLLLTSPLVACVTSFLPPPQNQLVVPNTNTSSINKQWVQRLPLLAEHPPSSPFSAVISKLNNKLLVIVVITRYTINHRSKKLF